jgi:hypothetical protein
MDSKDIFEKNPLIGFKHMAFKPSIADLNMITRSVYWMVLGGSLRLNNQNNNALKVAMQTKSNRTNK